MVPTLQQDVSDIHITASYRSLVQQGSENNGGKPETNERNCDVAIGYVSE